MRNIVQQRGNVIGILGLGIAVGIGLWIEFWHGQKPCPLCYLQRVAMMGIALSLYWNLAFSFKIHHYASALFWNLFGMLVALRHLAINVCKEPKATSFFFFSLRIYTWSFMVFSLSLLGICSLLFLYKSSEERASSCVRLVVGGALLIILSVCAYSALHC